MTFEKPEKKEKKVDAEVQFEIEFIQQQAKAAATETTFKWVV